MGDVCKLMLSDDQHRLAVERMKRIRDRRLERQNPGIMSSAPIKGRRTGRPSPHLSRPANCMVSIRKPTSPTCSQSSSISGLHRASTSSSLGVGPHSVPPIASRRNHEGDSRSRSIQRKNQAIGTVGSENRLRYKCSGNAHSINAVVLQARSGSATKARLMPS